MVVDQTEDFLNVRGVLRDAGYLQEGMSLTFCVQEVVKRLQDWEAGRVIKATDDYAWGEGHPIETVGPGEGKPPTTPTFAKVKLTGPISYEENIGITTEEVEKRANAVAKWLFLNTPLPTSHCIAVGMIVRGREPEVASVVTWETYTDAPVSVVRMPKEVLEMAASFIEPKQTEEEMLKQSGLMSHFSESYKHQGRWHALKWAAQALRGAFK